MKILVGEHAGFCFGVRRAVEQATALAARGVPCATLGPLIHNPQEVARLAGIGVRCAARPEDVSPGETLIVRSHGVPPALLARARATGADILDLTCPHVSNVQRLARETEADRTLIIVGEADHPEVQGISGWCRSQVLILPDEAAAAAAALPEKAAVVAQTTIRLETFERVLAVLRRRIPDLAVHRTICAATGQRQEEAERLAGRCDAMVVVGGANSSNTRKLYETCRARCPRTLAAQTPEDIPEDFCGGDDTVGVTAGASTPAWLLEAVLARLSGLGGAECQLVPAGIRRDHI